MLVQLKRPFFANGVFYPKSEPRAPTPVPNTLRKLLPKDAVVVSEEPLPEPTISHKPGSYFAFLRGDAQPVETLAAADETRGASDVGAAKELDAALAKKREEFQKALEAERRSAKK